MSFGLKTGIFSLKNRDFTDKNFLFRNWDFEPGTILLAPKNMILL
jgi:hypothetical protein